MGDTRKIVRATKEIVVEIGGERYQALLIPERPIVEVDFTQCPEDDPLRRQVNEERLAKVQLDEEDDVERFGNTVHLTASGAKKRLESL